MRYVLTFQREVKALTSLRIFTDSSESSLNANHSMCVDEVSDQHLAKLATYRHLRDKYMYQHLVCLLIYRL